MGGGGTATHPVPRGACPVLTVTAAAGGDGARQLPRVPALRLSHDAELPLYQPLQLGGRQVAQHLREVRVLPGRGTVPWLSHGVASRLPGHVGEWTALPPR